MAPRTISGLHVEDSGTGAPAVLLHSAGLSGRQWKRLGAELVERRHRAIVPDLTGHGASDAWPEPVPFSFRTDVSRVAEILEGVGPAHVVGHSYGGLVALQVALAAPGSIRSLSLFDPVAFGVLEEVEDRDARAVLSELDPSWGPSPSDRERWLRSFVDFWGGTGAWSALREEARAEFRRVAWVVREGVLSLMEDATPLPAYGRFPFPVQLLTGAKSPAPARRVVDRLGAAIRGARVAVVPGAGHLAPVTHADVVNGLLLEGILRAGT